MPKLIRFVLDVEPIEESIRGRLGTSAENQLEFASWLGLLALLGNLIEDRAGGQAPPEEQHP